MLGRVDIKFFKDAVGLSNIGRESSVDINARCPICGDSTKSKSKKRLHLYNKGAVTNVNCFNGDCPVKNKTMYSFLRDFYPNLIDSYKKETFGSTIESFKKNKESLKDIGESVKEKIESEKPVSTLDLSPYLKEIEDTSGIEYLVNRGISYDKDIFGQWYYGYQNLEIGETLYNIADSIVIPLYYTLESKNMYGFYSRSTNRKDFVTYMDDSNIGYKIWNWFNIDLNEPVYIFEGIFDAISSGKKNVIALLGAKLPNERLKDMKRPIFCLDNDRTGWLNSIEYAKLGYDIYVQPNDLKIKDMNEIILETDINTSDLIDNNIYRGISAITRIKTKL